MQFCLFLFSEFSHGTQCPDHELPCQHVNICLAMAHNVQTMTYHVNMSTPVNTLFKEKSCSNIYTSF